MTVWFKQGVVGDLQSVAQKGLGRVAKLLESASTDLLITSIRDGNHSPGSLHYIGLAFDFRPFITNELLSLELVKKVLGSDWDVIDEGHHIHAEFDPKDR